MSEQKPSLTYRDAGVDIDAGNELVDRIKNTAARTRRPEVLGGLGGFGAMVAIPLATMSRCWYQAPTASAPSFDLRCNSRSTTPLALTLWPCVSTTW